MTTEIRTSDGQYVFSSRGFRELGREVVRVSDARKKIEEFFNLMEESAMSGYTQFIVWSFINGRRKRAVVSTFSENVIDGIEGVAFWPENTDGRLSKNFLWISRNFHDEEKTQPDEEIPFKTWQVTAEERFTLPPNSEVSRGLLERISRECDNTYDFGSTRREISPIAAASFIGEINPMTVSSL